jgi:predicted transcriptional regulator
MSVGDNHMTKTEERLQARQLRQEKGLAVGKIADMLGVSRSTVSQWVRDIPLTTDQRHQLM